MYVYFFRTRLLVLSKYNFKKCWLICFHQSQSNRYSSKTMIRPLDFLSLGKISQLFALDQWTILSVSLLIWEAPSSIDFARWRFSLFSSDASFWKQKRYVGLSQNYLNIYYKLTSSQQRFVNIIQVDLVTWNNCFYWNRVDWNLFSINHFVIWVLEITASLRTNSKKSVLNIAESLDLSST